MKPSFAIGSRIWFDDIPWRVERYHKVAGEWELLIRSEATKVSRSILCSQLESWLRK